MKKNSGFTLLEIVVAMGITIMMGYLFVMLARDTTFK